VERTAWGRLIDRLRGRPGRRGCRRPAVRDLRRVVRARLGIAAAGLAAWALVLEVRLVHLQIFQHDELAARAERQQLRTIEAPAKRGEIRDRAGRVLAYSVDAESIYAVPAEIADPARTSAALCAALDDCDARERRTIEERLGRPRAFAFVRRRVSPAEARRVAALRLDGIGFLQETRRYYPKLELAAHVLGYVGADNVGLHGVEAAYDALVRGRPGRILIQTDARRHALFSRVERPPTMGADLELTIDEYLQHVAERELRAAVEEHRAQGGTVILLEPWSGEILAMANWPTFNPNAFSRYPVWQHRNRAIQEIYEPGSTFKIVTASAALEERLVDPADVIDVSAGAIRLGARVIDDVHRHDRLSFTDVIVKSSNVGAVRIGLKLGAERLGRYVRRFGFGQTLSPDFRGESPGIVWDPARLDDSALASVSMGYQVGVTPLQMAAAVASIANGGELVQPRVVRAIGRGARRVETERRVLRRTVSPRTAAVLTGIMEAVVERGTARAARLDDYQVAGKTGTAAKLVDGRYSRSDYIASFVGFVPSRRPALVVLVVLDSPRRGGYYGGQVAAPVFKRIAEAALRHLGVPPTINPLPPVLVAARRDDGPQPTPAVATRLHPSVLRPVRQGTMPDLAGLGAREALRLTARLGLHAALEGDGIVVAQEPAPGEPVEPGSACTLVLRRERPADAEARRGEGQ
jgi:cell division protein FtsI (penicillin-binding protein 3)